MSKKRWGLIVGLGLVLIVVLAGAAFALGRALRPYNLHAVELDPPKPATDFTFISSRTGQPVSLSDFRGKVVLLYFGYTTCPDVCPATLTDYKRVYEILGDKTKDVQFLWVTVDPERDTPEKMEDYVSHFNSEFLGLIPPSAEDLARVAAAYNVYYERHDYGSGAGYLMDHTATVALIDPQGMWRAIIPFQADPQETADDIEYLIKEAR
ncbi:MAG TPA: SCO family protein [Anaerolineae bacterium]|nr:SCO family protein [Anaerolineae bacterium]